eukprot:COSAG06_NODE_769_length_12440_cov_7.241796_5_plen_49_part_00
MRGSGGLARGSSQVDDGVLEEDEEDEADLKGCVRKPAFYFAFPILRSK